MKETAQAEGSAGKGRLPASLLLVLALVLAVFWQTGSHGFIDVDDPGYVSKNPVVLKGLTSEGVRWAFTTFHVANWHPLTWLSHMADVELFGRDPGRHHLVNVLFHGANSALLLLVLFRMTGALGASLLAASLFAIHPLHVESAAWVAERKDLLCALFIFLTLLCWHRYVVRPGTAWYLLSVGSYVLALLSKPMAVSLPLLLLLLDLWPFRRLPGLPPDPSPDVLSVTPVPWKRLLAEKAPFFLLAAASCVMTVLAQERGGAVGDLRAFPLGDRIVNAVVSAAAYLGKTAWPSSLSFFYPHPSMTGGIPAWKACVSALVLAGASFLAWRERGRRPWIAFGWLWYLVTLAPVIGIVQVGTQAMADRYTYLPLVGIFAAVAWSGDDTVRRGLLPRRAAAGAGAVAVLLLALAAWFQAGYWKDGLSLYSHAVSLDDRNGPALNNLGVARFERGEVEEAIRWYRESLRVAPDDAMTWNNLAGALEKAGRGGEALPAYREALRLSPSLGTAWVNLGVLQRNLGRSGEAEAAFLEALRIDPRDGAAWNQIGATRVREGRLPDAVDAFRKALDADPDDARVAFNLALAYDTLGDPARAEDGYRTALRIRPDLIEAWVNLGILQARQGRVEEAAATLREAIRIRPDDPVARRVLEDLK